MGNYAVCWFNGLKLGETKSDVDPNLISLFRASDKHIAFYPSKNIPKELKSHRSSQREEPELPIVYYEAYAYIIKDRLDVLGYSFKTAETAFLKWRDNKKIQLLESIEEIDNNGGEHSIVLREHYLRALEIIDNLTATNWLKALKEIRKYKIKPDYATVYEAPKDYALYDYMLTNEWFGFPGFDRYVPLRLLLEDAKPNEKLIYDLTDLLWAEYVEADEDLVSYGLEVTGHLKAKTIILTEGHTDTWVLKESLSLLYPHLSEYYSFMDFENAKVGGGVGNLANMVKAFAGAGVVNNVIALFDNDTAAASALKKIEKADLPLNIKIIKLPELDFLSCYPTIGPSGDVSLDVNGIAASIELYFGEDILKVDGLNLTPIQWTGYEISLKQYQGEVIEKKVLQDRFRDKLNTAMIEGNVELDNTWDHLRLIFRSIFNASEDTNRKSIFNLIDNYCS